ncbi:MAG: ATP-binding protein [Bacteroidota bacterium]|nr:ATP-binding protein [Bacteroidota bacterium]
MTIASCFFLSFLIILIGLSSYYQNFNKSNLAFNRFISEFEKNEKSVSEYLRQGEKIISIPENGKEDIYNIYPDDMYQKEGILILIFQEDSLFFWSANSTPFSKIDFLNLDAPGIIHLQNGFYYVDEIITGEYQIVGLSLLSYHYPYENAFLKNEFHQQYTVPAGTGILLSPSGYDIYDSGDKFLFSLKFPSSPSITSFQHALLFLLYILTFISFIILLFHLYEKLAGFLRNKYIYLVTFSLDLLILRWLLYFFKIPGILYSSSFFTASFYAHSDLFPSPGDLILNLLLVLAIASVFNLKFRSRLGLLTRKPVLSFFLGYLFLTLAFALFFPFLSLSRSLVYDANFSLNLSDISLISTYSFIGLSAIFILLLSYFLISIRLFEYAYRSSYGKFKYFIIQWLLAAISTILINISFRITDYIFVFFIAVYIISLFFFKAYQRRIFTFYSTIFYLFLFSIFTTYSLQTLITAKEKEERKLIAMQLSRTYNPMVEYNFTVASKEICRDLKLQGLLVLSYDDPMYEDSAVQYLENQYLQHVFPGYERYSTICFPEKILDIQPDDYLIDCKAYFNGLIRDFGDSSLCEHLYRYNIKESNSYISHLGIPVAIADHIINFDIFSELFSPFIPDEGLGYPELLIEDQFDHFPKTANYSYARYSDGQLVYKFGNYIYSTNLPVHLFIEEGSFFTQNGYNHYFAPIDDHHHLVLSKKNLSLPDAIAPFSYLLLFYAIYTLIFLLLIVFPYENYALNINFRSRIQVSIITIIVIIFIIIGNVSVAYIQDLNNKKNNAILREKTHSVLIELEHKLADQPQLSADMHSYLSGLLTKFSLVFFSDINLYDLSGKLLATSRPRIFEKGLISTRMNSDAYRMLDINKNLLFIHEEKIGTYNYLSAYIPFRNSQNMIVAYLNLPYFAKQSDLRTEISSFLTTFLNIYIFFIALSIFLTLLISRYTTRPLQLIKDKMRSLSLGRSNQKIDWASNDEIGKLVSEYNRMIDELSKSADLLAQSERESAWREMAKQVAHEIKNPLTPMKLNVQYLEKAWNDGSSDFDKRLKRFTKTIIEQIDTLSMIASEFSDFAKMPQARSRKAKLIEIIRNATNLFKDTENIHLEIEYDDSRNYTVLVDEKQLLRVFNNLIQNAIEAIGPDRQGNIKISIETEQDEFIIKVTDDGPGISSDQSDKIFSPSFTTKTSGMGLGLAMVKSIVINSGGTITFESEEGFGATFIIRLPII